MWLFTSKTVRKHGKFISDHKNFIIRVLPFVILHPHFSILIFPYLFSIFILSSEFSHPHFFIRIFQPHFPSLQTPLYADKNQPRYKLGRISFFLLLYGSRKLLVITLQPMVAPVVFLSGFKDGVVATWKASCEKL